MESFVVRVKYKDNGEERNTSHLSRQALVELLTTRTDLVILSIAVVN